MPQHWMPQHWLAILAFLLIVHPLVARVARLGAAVAGAAVGGFLGWVDPALAVLVAVPLVAGVLADRRVTAVRVAGMSAVRVVLDQVGAGTAQLISAGHGERVRQDQVATVDRFHEVFTARTRQVGAAVTWAEIAFSPVTILAVTLSAGMLLVTPKAEMLAFLLLGPLVGGCVARLTQRQPPDARPPPTAGTPAKIHTTLERLRSVVASGSEMRQAAIAAIVTALVHGVSLAVAITVVRSLFEQSGWPWLPLFVLLALFLGHTLTLCWSISSAQVVGVAVLRQLSYLIIDRIFTTPQGSLTEYKDQLPRLVTRDVVTVSGLPAHALRSFVSAGLMPVAAALTMIVTEWRLGISVLLLVPLAVLVAGVLLRKPCRELRSAFAAVNRILSFLGAGQGVSLPGVEK